MRKSLLQVLIERDGMPEEEAKKLIKEVKEVLLDRIENGEDAYDICEEYFGLEPDYLNDLI